MFRHGILTGWFSMPRGFYAFGLGRVFSQASCPLMANWLKSATKWALPPCQTLASERNYSCSNWTVRNLTGQSSKAGHLTGQSGSVQRIKRNGVELNLNPLQLSLAASQLHHSLPEFSFTNPLASPLSYRSLHSSTAWLVVTSHRFLTIGKRD